MAASIVTISNDALGELREKPIQSMDEGSFQAQECSRVYPQVLEEMLEGHEWSFASQRVLLAQVANDRPTEWPYAYAMPQGVGVARRVLPVTDGMTFYTAGWPLTWYAGCERDYRIEAGVLYSWLSAVILEYGAADVTPDLMTAQFRRALALGMAERLAISIRDSPTLQKSIGDRGAVAMQRAMADDMNRQPQGHDLPDVGAVRMGGSIGLIGRG